MNRISSTTNSSPIKPGQYVISLKLNGMDNQRMATSNFQSYTQEYKNQRPSTAGVRSSSNYERLKEKEQIFTGGGGEGDTSRRVNDRYMVKTLEDKEEASQKHKKQPQQSYDEKDYLKLTQSYCLRTFEKKNEKHRLLLGKSISDWSAERDTCSNRVTLANRKKYKVAEELINSRDSSIGMWRRIPQKKHDEFTVSESEKQEMRKRLGRLIENQKITQNKQITDQSSFQGNKQQQQQSDQSGQLNPQIGQDQHSKLHTDNIQDSTNKKPAALTLLLSQAHAQITDLMNQQQQVASLTKSELINKSTRNTPSNKSQTLHQNDRKQSIFIGQNSFYYGRDDDNDQGCRTNYVSLNTRRNTIQSTSGIAETSRKELCRKIPNDYSFSDSPIIAKIPNNLHKENPTNFTMVYTSKRLYARQLRKSCNGIGQQKIKEKKQTKQKQEEENKMNLTIESRDNDQKMYSASVWQSPLRRNRMNTSLEQWNLKIKEKNNVNSEEFELEQRMNKAWQVDKNGELQLQISKPSQMKREVYSAQRAQRMIASLRVTFLTFLRKCDLLSVDPIQALDNHYFDRKPLSRPGSFVLFVSIREKQEDFALELLQKDRQLIYEKDERLQNPLHAALSNGLKRLALWLIHNGVDFEQRDLANKTPLYYCLTRGMLDLAKYLLFRRANPWAESKTYRYETITHNNAIISCFRKSKQADLCWRMSHDQGTQKQVWLKKRCFLYTDSGCSIYQDLDCLTPEEQKEVANARINQIEQERIENSLSSRSSDYYLGLLQSKKGRKK